jgi:cold-inducible RNA-binding protein
MTNLYVGNLAWGTTEDALREAFARHGTVTKVQIILDRETGRPRGFAFVEMSDGAEAAIAGMNGTQLDGRTLTVNEAKPREGGGGGRAAMGAAGAAAAGMAGGAGTARAGAVAGTRKRREQTAPASRRGHFVVRRPTRRPQESPCSTPAPCRRRTAGGPSSPSRLT